MVEEVEKNPPAIRITRLSGGIRRTLVINGSVILRITCRTGNRFPTERDRITVTRVASSFSQTPPPLKCSALILSSPLASILQSFYPSLFPKPKKMAASLRSLFLISLFIPILLLFNLRSACATDHIVGDNHGWNPGVNYTLWAGNHTFYVADEISFRYTKTQYNVYMVNQSGYDNCTTEGAMGNWSSGKDFITLDKAKRYWFICGNGGCFSGMKVTVLVHELPKAAPPSKKISGADRSLLMGCGSIGIWVSVAAAALAAAVLLG